MPTYEYYCSDEDCEHEFEVFQSMREDSLRDCSVCEKPALKRKIGLGAGIIFKGSGFYETDYKTKSGSNTENDSKKNESSENKAEKASKESSIPKTD